jgi:Family of unknown function (DUF6093)
MSLVDDLLQGRVEAEAIMTNECIARRPGVDYTDPDGVVVTPLVDVYAGRCKVQTTVAQAATPVAGGHGFTVENLQLHVPVLTPLKTGDVATITTAGLDPSLVGLTFRLVELARGSQRTAARWNVELVTA